ncbi:MAG: glycosyltransferase family 4 protein [Chloroflexota bacterium]
MTALAAPEATARDRPAPETAPLRVAYVMSRFPKLTETFILFEMAAVERQGPEIRLFPLLRERESAMHPEAAPYVARATYLPFLSPAILGSHGYFLRHAPRRYLGTLGAMLRGTWRSPNFLLGGIGIFPKVVHAARLMQRDGVSHVHCHFATHPALAGFLIQRLVGIPYSFTAHGSDLHVDRTMLCRKVAEAAFTVTISDDNRAVFERECGGPITSLEVIHCGVDTTVFHPVPRMAASDRPLAILAIGTLHEVKGQTHLIEACRLLATAGVPFTCRFVGEGPDRAALEHQVADAGLSDRVEFLGRRTRAEIASLIGSSDVLVAASVPTRSGKREGIPVVLMEAMSAGLPVVASALSGIPELVVDGSSGLTVPPGDAAAIAAALRRLHVDPELRTRLGVAARERVMAEFDVDRNAHRLIERFAAVASELRDRPAHASAPGPTRAAR